MEELRRLIKEGPANDIWMFARAEALFLETFHVPSLEKDHWPLVMVSRQHALSLCILLACRPFDPPKKYGTLGFQRIYEYIAENAGDLAPVAPSVLGIIMGRPVCTDVLSDGNRGPLSDEERTEVTAREKKGITHLLKAFAKHGLDTLPKAEIDTGVELNDCLEHVRRWRDKHVAHNEIIPENDGLVPKMHQLHQHAIQLLHPMVHAFFGHGDYPYARGILPTEGSGEAARSLADLAKHMGDCQK